ncbi:MAG: flagellar basal body L-ring protein FlgH [Phycisphaerae bacterium]|nr:flagellar basal body L-ring protein FlgH [Phycisphaerae bacterium]
MKRIHWKSELAAGAVVIAALWFLITVAAHGQTSSLYLRAQADAMVRAAATTQPVAPDGGIPVDAGALQPVDPNSNVVLQSQSYISVLPPEPRRFKVHDLVNIVVRHQLRYRADGRLEQNRTWKFEAELAEWFRIHDRKWQQQEFPTGNPQVDFELTDNRRSTGRNQRQDELTTRIAAEVVDVKPNGTLVLQATARYRHEEEDQTITLTGICRSEDISADNSILSDKIANLDVSTVNEGSVRDTTKRGIIPRVFDLVKPF